MEDPELIYCEVKDTEKEVQPLPPPLPKRDNFPASIIEVNSPGRIPPPKTLTVITNSCKRCSRNSTSRKQVLLAIAVAILAILSTVFVTMYLMTEGKDKPCACPNCLANNGNTSFHCSLVGNCSKFNISTITGSNTELLYSSSCEEILQRNSSAKNGTYIMNLDGYINAYCQMTSLPGCSGGGWTLVMKIDGREETFRYASPYWNNTKSYNPAGGQTGFDEQETKLPSYWKTPFKELCLGMKVANERKFVSIKYSASSLYSLFADGRYRSTNIGKAKWRSLIRDSSMQMNCNREGFNARGYDHQQSSVRLGMITNNQNDCSSTDSFIGFGGPASSRRDYCGVSGITNTCGNSAYCSPDNGDREIKAMGYIFVR